MVEVPQRSRPAVLLLLALSAATVPTLAATPEEVFLEANNAYEAGRFEEAAEGYQSLLRYEFRDPVLEYNLAGALFKLGYLGPAILHYERAARLDPTDRDIRANLAFARTFCVDRVEPPPQPAKQCQ